MKKILSFILALTLCLPLLATRERRVYYLDCSYSMKSNGLWKDVRDNLFKAIDNIEDETTELYVIPFAVDGSDRARLDAFVEIATPEGKERLKNKIKHIEPSKTSMTYHWNPINDFYENNRITQDGITYLFLITDGKDEHKDPNKFPRLLKEWQKRCGDKNVYGFYVMLHPSARNPLATEAINTQNHLWEVETADLNINLIHITSGAILNVRDDSMKHVDIPISGQTSHLQLTLTATSEYYAITQYEQHPDYLRVYVDSKKELSLIPELVDIDIHASITNPGKFDFLLTENVTLRCENKYVKAINPTFDKGKKIEKLGEVSYYPPFLWSEEKTESLTTTLQLQPSSDAKANNCFAEFEFVDKDGNSIPAEELRITVNDDLLEENRFRADCSDCNYKITFEYLPAAKDGKHQGYLKLVSHNLDRCGNEDLLRKSYANALCWQIKYDKCMNPLAKCLLLLLILALTALMMWFVVFRPIFYPQFGSVQKTFTAPSMAPLIVKFKGARLVVISATPPKKQSSWNRFWTGKIIYKTHPAFTHPITLKPSRGKRILMKHPIGTYQVMPNPIPYVGTATIIDITKNIKINVN